MCKCLNKHFIKFILIISIVKVNIINLQGDYGQVEGKYDIPASTSCGSTDQIVVETSDAAHACIHELRTNNIGRLTFSIIPQIARLKPRADAINIQ